MPTIRIDDEVWRHLQSKAKPFEDSPNDVLRRELGIGSTTAVPRSVQGSTYRLVGKLPKEPGPQEKLVYDVLRARAAPPTADELTADVLETHKLQTKQPPKQVVLYYLNQWRKANVVELGPEMAEPQSLAGSNAKPASDDFNPVEIRGESLSTTILRERR